MALSYFILKAEQKLTPTATNSGGHGPRPQARKQTNRMHGNPVSQIEYDNGVESICIRKKRGRFKSLQGALSNLDHPRPTQLFIFHPQRNVIWILSLTHAERWMANCLSLVFFIN